MKKIKQYKLVLLKRFIIISTGILLFALHSCTDFLTKEPLDQLSDNTFWKNEKDARMALVGCYQVNNGMWLEGDWWSYRGLLWLEFATDNAFDRRGIHSNQSKLTSGDNISTNRVPQNYWQSSYKKIARCNNFLENIENVKMDEAEKKQMIAEVRFLRACQYFYLSQFWGAVPLVTKVLTIDEANSITRTPKNEVVDFVLSELTETANDLPVSWDPSDDGRATKGAALAFKGRLQMAEKSWADAASTYKSIIDLGVYGIDPRYEELFLESGENSPEIIFSNQLIENLLPSGILQHHYPFIAGGWHVMCPLNSIVDEYECTDGKSIDESPLYDPSHPFENRDPRLYMSVLLPNYSTFKGILYVTHPDSITAPDRVPTKTKTGYGLRKFLDENYSGDLYNYGGNLPLVRYSEILLSYLESVIESGQSVNQALLDETINKVRGRASVNLPPVTELDPDKLLTIVRHERRVELAFEGVRYWDLLRWGIADEVLDADFYGAKIADSPDDTPYQVDATGHYYVCTRHFRKDVDYLWPIPQTEIDINPNLTQNPGY